MSNLPFMLELTCCHKHKGHDVSIDDGELRLAFDPHLTAHLRVLSASGD